MTRKSCAELKMEARRALKGKYGTAAGATLVFIMLIVIVAIAVEFFLVISIISNAAVNAVFDSPAMDVGSMAVSSLCSLVIVAAEYMIIPGYMKLHLNICTGQGYELGNLFYAFTHKPYKFLLLALVMWLVSLIVTVPMLAVSLLALILPVWAAVVLIIAAIIAGYAVVIILMLKLSMSFFILLEEPDTGVIQCLKESCRIMRGNMGRLFYIGLSFIGIGFVTMLSFGLGYLWVAPYICATTTFFYLDIRGSREKELVWGDQTSV